MITKKALQGSLSIVLFVFSVWVIIESLDLSLGEIQEPGPGFIPFYAAIFMGALSLYNVVALLLTHKENEQAFSSFENLKELIYVIAIMTISVFFWETLGYFITASVVMISTMKIYGKDSWPKILIITFFAVSLSFLLFKFILQIELPLGIFEF
jgi:putative tricarboxylic transport membrane protein